MHSKFLQIGAVFLFMAATISPSWAITDVYVGMSDATAAGGVSGPSIVRYTYDSSKPVGDRYTFSGVTALAAGNAASLIELNSSPGATGGIYAGITGSTNVLREYSFSGGSFSQLRQNGSELTDLAIGPDDRVYGYETVTGSLINYQANNGGFDQTLQGLGGPGSTGFVRVGSNNKIIAIGQDGGGNGFMTTHDFDGNTFTPDNANGSGFLPDAVAISPLNNTIWTAENSVGEAGGPGPGFDFRTYQFAFEDDIPGCPCPPGPIGGPFPLNVAIGHLGSFDMDSEVDQLVVNADDIAIGVSQNYNAGQNFGGRGSYLLGWSGSPHTIDTGTGGMSLRIASRIADEGTPFVVDVDDEGTIHVFGDGMLQAWEINNEDGNINTGALFQAVGVTGGGLLGAPHAIATAASTITPVLDGDFNGNDEVELGDLNLVLFNWNQPAPSEWVQQIPPDNVGLDELNLVLFNWGNMAAVATVPEPATWTLCSVCVAFGLIWRRGKRR